MSTQRKVRRERANVLLPFHECETNDKDYWYNLKVSTRPYSIELKVYTLVLSRLLERHESLLKYVFYYNKTFTCNYP